jgi:hypothetical protein
MDQSLATRQGITVAKHRDVAEVQRDGVDSNQHLALLRVRGILLPQFQIIQAREIVESISLHLEISVLVLRRSDRIEPYAWQT